MKAEANDHDQGLNETELDMLTMAQMVIHGSPFVSRLGRALQYATVEQMRAIEQAFPRVWATYRKMAVHVDGRAAV